MRDDVRRFGEWLCVKRDGYWFKCRDLEWWHWDETESIAFGPFKTLRQARRSLAAYVKELNR